MSLSRPPCASSSLRSSSFVREQGRQRAETAEARSESSPHRGSTPSSAEGVLTEAVQATSSRRPYRAPGVRRGTSGDRRSASAPLGWSFWPSTGHREAARIPCNKNNSLHPYLGKSISIASRLVHASG